MKTGNPNSRYELHIRQGDRVLEVGGGHNPHPRSNVVVDKFIDSNYHRHSDIKVLKHQEFLQADGENLPFADKEFDYVICNQVLEHVDDPAAFLNEQMRVAKRGYIETPSLVGEYLFPKESHRWLILDLYGKLVIVDKESHWFRTRFDFGYLFLTWLPKTSVGYKVLMDTKPNLMTTRYEWKDTIEYEVNPTNTDYTRFFTEPWDEEMTQLFFPAKSRSQELASAMRAIRRIVSGALRRKVTGSSY